MLVVQSCSLPTCQGFSAMGRREGFQHVGSSLFLHIVRLVKELQPSCVFLENVPEIVRMGLDNVVESLCVQLQSELKWTVMGAVDIGTVFPSTMKP